MRYEEYYRIPWPLCQKLYKVFDENPHDADFIDYNAGAGAYVEKEWFDEHHTEYGL